MRIIQVEPKDLASAWPHAAPWLEKAGLRGNSTYPLEDTRRDIEQDKKLLFKCVNGEKFCWLVLGCVENSAGRRATVYACGGRGVLDMLRDVVAFVEAYAVWNKCQHVTCGGRAGWVKALAPYGWAETSRICGKDLGHE